MGGKCTEIDMFPNATVAEYGSIDDGDIHKIMAEIYARGPVAAVVNAEPIVAYSGGVFKDKRASKETNHIVSIVGWDRTSKKHGHWIVRNSWGQVSFMRSIVLPGSCENRLFCYAFINKTRLTPKFCCFLFCIQYWGEMGYFRIAMGHNILGIESEIAWATPGSFTTSNFPCSEDGKNCSPGEPNYVSENYIDPSRDVAAVQMRLHQADKGSLAEK